MIPVDLNSQVTFLSGRPSSGKTRSAIKACRSLMSQKWNVIYWHAEGSTDTHPTEYGVETPEQLLQMQLITELHFSCEDLRKRINRPTEVINPAGTVVVIDTLDLFDYIPDDFIQFMETFEQNNNLRFLVLTQVPRYLEKKTKDHVEEFVRTAYPTKLDSQIVVVGNIPDECS